jgi:hypothetical protein
VVAYVWQDPGGDQKPNSDQIETSAYDPDSKSWGAPVTQATGDFEGRFGTDMSIAGDPGTDVVVVAYSTGTVDGTTGIAVAVSVDGGQTWAQSTVSTTAQASRPSVAVGGGKIYVAYPVADGGLHLATSDGTTNPTFDDVTLPGDGDGYPTANEQPAIAIAPDGTPLVAYDTDTGADYNREVLAWSPGEDQPVKVLDSQGTQNDSATVALTFQGAKALVVSSLVRGDEDPNIGYLATSNDDGKTWSPDKGAPVPAIQPVSSPFSYALAGGTVLAYYPNGGSARTCQGVVLMGTTDLKTWKSCDPFAAAFPSVAEQYYPGATADTDGSVLVAFANGDNGDPTVPTGILVWNDGGQPVAGEGG